MARSRSQLAGAVLVLGGALFAGRCFLPAPQPQATFAPSLAGSASLAAAFAAPGAAAALAPSGVDGWAPPQQAAAVAAIFAALGAGTAALLKLFEVLRELLPEGWFAGWQKTWPILGAVYMAAGVAHFTAKEAFEAIYPPQGTWGFWYLPGSASFHVAWTGVAEIAGGAGLFLGALLLAAAGAFSWEVPKAVRQLHAAAALGLFGLTWAVTPANVYMYTHGAQMTGLTPGDQPIPVEFHAVRGLLQVLLLGILWSYSRLAWEEAEKA